MPFTNEKLREIMIEHGLLDEAQFAENQAIAERENKSLERILVEKGLVIDEQMGRLLADEAHYSFVNLRRENIPENILDIVPELMAKKQEIIPFGRNQDGLKLAMHDPENLDAIRVIEKKTGEKVIPYFATESDIREALSQYKLAIKGELKDLIEETIKSAKVKGGKSEELAEEAPVVRFTEAILEYAYQNRASDIHVEPRENDVIVRYRIDGILHDVIDFSKQVYELVLTRIKIMSRLRTDEHKAAQDGRFTFKVDEDRVDVRLSVVPITNGEKAVMRLLSSRAQKLDLDDLGLGQEDLQKLRNGCAKSYGMILSTGPTGSGKTTTLYSILQELNSRKVNITTIEDPVEYEIEGINQIQVNAKVGLTFAKGLRTVVRQNPDIILIGEIRDQESAKIAVNMAMTGHLVLSTLHTNTASTSLPRLFDLGVEPFLIASSVNAIIGQRLLRQICPRCIESYVLDAKQFEILRRVVDLKKIMGREVKELRLYRGRGCAVCNNVGYNGRTGIFEILEISESIRSLIMKKASADEVEKEAIRAGMTTMIEDGVKKMLSGQTTFEELFRVIHE